MLIKQIQKKHYFLYYYTRMIVIKVHFILSGFKYDALTLKLII